jgi:hypothetical protein
MGSGIVVTATVVVLSAIAYLLIQRPYLSPSIATLSASSSLPNLAVVTVSEGVIALTPSPIPSVPYGKVLIRVHYAPINPSDAYRALGTYKFDGMEDGFPHLNGFEGSGVVVGSGGGLMASLFALFGTRVAFVAPEGGSWSRYVIADPMELFPLAMSGVSDLHGSAAFVNPITVVGMLEVAKSSSPLSLPLPLPLSPPLSLFPSSSLSLSLSLPRQTF